MKEKRRPFSLQTEVSCYHFEVRGAAICCTFLLHTLRNLSILFLGGQVDMKWNSPFEFTIVMNSTKGLFHVHVLKFTIRVEY